jgi:D-tyrosyl-tRNA(Tyr) deacylase
MVSMKMIVQRVASADVLVDGESVGSIKKGYFVLLGVKEGDSIDDANVLTEKLSKLRVMADENDKMNVDLGNSGGEVLVVSQFTLFADTKKGNRPAFTKAARPELAEKLYKAFVENLKDKGLTVETGEFGAMMDIKIELDGPVTIIIES